LFLSFFPWQLAPSILKIYFDLSESCEFYISSWSMCFIFWLWLSSFFSNISNNLAKYSLRSLFHLTLCLTSYLIISSLISSSSYRSYLVIAYHVAFSFRIRLFTFNESLFMFFWIIWSYSEFLFIISLWLKSYESKQDWSKIVMLSLDS
jgi:hypothetical protein